MIELFHVYKGYGRGVQALTDISLSIKRGELVLITGPTGAGKTTLLRLILAYEQADGGQMVVNGRNLAAIKARDIPHHRRAIGMVFQDFKLLQRRTILDNLTLVLRAIGTPRREVKRRAWQALKMVGLHGKLDLYPPRLSGGEQQRVAIARALVKEPTILLADEPTGNLDQAMAREILDLFRQANSRGTTVVMATHDRRLVSEIGQRVVFLNGGRIHEE